MATTPEPVLSGWQTYLGSDQRKAHYFHHDSTSLCGKRGFYFGELTPPTPGANQPDDCAECKRKLAMLQKAEAEAKDAASAALHRETPPTDEEVRQVLELSARHEARLLGRHDVIGWLDANGFTQAAAEAADWYMIPR